MIFRETLMDMIGERRLTGRVDAGWTAAVFHLSSGTLWVADVHNAGPAGLGLTLDAPIDVEDRVEIALRDARGRHAKVAGSVVFAPRHLDHRLGVNLTQLDAAYIDLLIAAFQAEALASATSSRVDYGLAEVTSLPVRQPTLQEEDTGGWRTRNLAEVIPYRKTPLDLLPDRALG